MIDILSKIVIDNFLSLNESIIIINNFFRITKAYNYGASWSILSGYQLILILVSIIALILLVIYSKIFTFNNRNNIAFSMLYAGILGNLLNRIFLGYVIDFFDFKIFNYDYPIFNMADIFIVISTFLIIIAILKKEDENGISSKR